jgi:hypothetical protein
MDTLPPLTLPAQPGQRPQRRRLLVVGLIILALALVVIASGLFVWQQQNNTPDASLIPPLPAILADLHPGLGADSIAELIEERLSLHGIDQDYDGLSNSAELLLYETDPLRYDSDFDGVTDSEEIVKSVAAAPHVHRARVAYWETDFALTPALKDASLRDQTRIADSGFARLLLSLHYKEHQSYPAGASWEAVWEALGADTSLPVDPLNQNPYVYAYSSGTEGQSFTFTYATELDQTRYQIADSNGELGTITTESVAQAGTLQSLWSWVKSRVATAHAQGTEGAIQTATTTDGFVLGISGNRAAYWLGEIPKKTKADLIADFLAAASTMIPPGTCDTDHCDGVNSTLHIALPQPGAPTLDFTVNDQSEVTIASGASATLAWNSNAASCTAAGSWSGAKTASGSFSTGAVTTDQTYTLTCPPAPVPIACVPTPTNLHATQLLAFSQGFTSNQISTPGNYAITIFGGEDKVLGPPQQQTSLSDVNFDSYEEPKGSGNHLPGYVVVGFAPGVVITNGNGKDFRIHLNDLNEPFETFVSNDGVTFLSVGKTTTTGPPFNPRQIDFDIAGTGLSQAKYVKVVNTNTVPTDHNDPTPDETTTNEGPDIDAFEILACSSLGVQPTVTRTVTVKVSGATPPQCSDGIDNDTPADRKIDCGPNGTPPDPGCLIYPAGTCNPTDNDEKDPGFKPGDIKETE